MANLDVNENEHLFWKCPADRKDLASNLSEFVMPECLSLSLNVSIISLRDCENVEANATGEMRRSTRVTMLQCDRIVECIHWMLPLRLPFNTSLVLRRYRGKSQEVSCNEKHQRGIYCENIWPLSGAMRYATVQSLWEYYSQCLKHVRDGVTNRVVYTENTPDSGSYFDYHPYSTAMGHRYISLLSRFTSLSTKVHKFQGLSL